MSERSWSKGRQSLRKLAAVNGVEHLKNKVYERIDLKMDTDDCTLKRIIEDCVCEESRRGFTSIEEREELTEYIFNAIRKLDILQELLEDDSVTEIMINGQNNIFLERKGRIYKWDKCFESRERLEDIAQRIAAVSNKIVNESVPIVDTRLNDGSRVNIVLPPIAIDGPVITIRKFYDNPLTMEKLLDISCSAGYKK